MIPVLSSITILFIFYYLYKGMKKKDWLTPKEPFPIEWKLILQEMVPFYQSLNNEEKVQFEYRCQEFLLNVRIIGVQTPVEEDDKVLIAASAIIPVFAFQKWKYTNLYEVFLYTERFNEDFETDGGGRNILGMVGTGVMEGKMALSKKALHLGFKNETDKKNTAIHEFVHLIDKMDNSVDGVPEVLMQKQYMIPWFKFIQGKMDEIHNDDSDINPYGGTNKQEFFAVASEYFFERPKLLERKHPELFKALKMIYQQDTKDRFSKRKEIEIGRNDLCICGSGKKFKHCCTEYLT